MAKEPITGYEYADWVHAGRKPVPSISKETMAGYEVEIGMPSVPYKGSCVLCGDDWLYLDTSLLCTTPEDVENVMCALDSIDLSMFDGDSVLWANGYNFQITRPVKVVK